MRSEFNFNALITLRTVKRITEMTEPLAVPKRGAKIVFFFLTGVGLAKGFIFLNKDGKYKK